MTKPFQFTRDEKSRQFVKWREDRRNGKLSQEEIIILEKNGFQWDLLDTSGQNKEELLKMARDGDSRPRARKHLLGYNLCSYTNKSHGCYDAEFDKKIRKLRPDWFIRKSDIADQKKEKLLKMARDGKPKPSRGHHLGNALNSYICKSATAYDAEFDKKIRKLRPDWFVCRSEKANQKKKELLKIARDGEPRPNKKRHSLGYCLCSYIRADVEFNKKIRKLRPDWFVSRSAIADQNKEELLKMARDGKPKPIVEKHSLGYCLRSYASKSSRCYDVEFDKKIRELRPDWFVSRSEIANQKKKELLKMSRSGDSRPHSKNHPLGKCLCRYTNKSSESYDPEFDKKIRELRPDWFREKI